jgi:hypothetical protein
MKGGGGKGVREGGAGVTGAEAWRGWSLLRCVENTEVKPAQQRRCVFGGGAGVPGGEAGPGVCRGK